MNIKKSKTLIRRDGLARGSMADNVKNSAAMKKMLELDSTLAPKEVNI